MSPTEVVLPWPPSVNTYIRHSRGIHFPTAKAKEFRAATLVAWRALRAPKFVGRLSIAIELYPPTKQARDIDNFVKATVDALMHAGAFEDDEQIDELLVSRRGVRKSGSAVVRISGCP